MSSKSRNSLSIWLSLLVSCLGSTAGSYTSVIPATTFAQPSFIQYMKLATLPNANDLIGAVSGVYFAGGMIGAVASSDITDYFGRRASIFISCLFHVIGGSLQAGSVNMAMFIAARLLAGIGIGALFCTVPVYTSEIAPPTVRGFAVGLHGIFIAVGTVLCNFCGLGFYFVDAGGAQWRPPLAIQCFFTLVLGSIVWFLPESPRWLMNKERCDKALHVLSKLHADKSDPDHAFAHQEFRQIKEQHEDEEKTRATWKQMWTIKSYRRRSLISFFVMAGSQMTAILVASLYSPLLLSGLGFGVVMQLALTGVWSCVAVVGNALCAFTIDRMGRVLALKLGWIFSGIGVIGICASLSIYAKTGSRSAGIAGVFFLYWHILSYGLFVDATTYIYCAELFPNNVRGKGMAIAIASYFATVLLQLTSAPSAFAALGWKLLIIYFAVLVVITPLLWVILPETKGKTLEEIGLLFGDRHTHVDLGNVEIAVNENGKGSSDINKERVEDINTVRSSIA